MSNAIEFGTETRRQLGMLAKQRREEIGLNRTALAEEAGIESDKTIEHFEFGKNLPSADTQRKLENALGWGLGVIEEVTQMTDRTAPLTMEELDAEDRQFIAGQGGLQSLATASDADLLAEVARRGI